RHTRFSRDWSSDVCSSDLKFSRTHTTNWNFNGKVWKRTNGTSAKEFGAKNLVVLWADEKDAGYTDPAGNPVPETTFEGKGKAVEIGRASCRERVWHRGGAR